MSDNVNDNVINHILKDLLNNNCLLVVHTMKYCNNCQVTCTLYMEALIYYVLTTCLGPVGSGSLQLNHSQSDTCWFSKEVGFASCEWETRRADVSCTNQAMPVWLITVTGDILQAALDPWNSATPTRHSTLNDDPQLGTTMCAPQHFKKS